MAQTTVTSFVNELMSQLLTSLQSKIVQLNERKALLEQYLSLDLVDKSEIDQIKARAKLEEVIDSLRFEERFEKHFVEVNNDIKAYKELTDSRQKLEREETIRDGLKQGLEYLDILNSFFLNVNLNNIPNELLKSYDVNLSEYLAMKSLNEMIQLERKQFFDVNVDHLACLVNGSTDKIKSSNYTYLDLKNVLDRIIKKKNMFSKYSNDSFKSTIRSISPIFINSNTLITTIPTSTSKIKNVNNLNTVTSIPVTISPETNKPILKLTPNKINTINTIEISNGLNYNETKENESNGEETEKTNSSQNDVIYNNVNLTKLGQDMSNNFSRESYAYTLTKIIFSRDERLNGWFADMSNLHSAKNKRIPFDLERVKILKNALNSTKFKLSNDPVEANLEWNQLRRGLNKKISKNLKKKAVPPPINNNNIN